MPILCMHTYLDDLIMHGNILAHVLIELFQVLD